MLDGINIQEYNLEYLRNIIGFVKQDNFLFNSSIKNNIILGREETLKETGDIDEIVEKACKEASIKNFIEEKPDKYEYNVGIQGRKLLPGHKQLISIARAILDEPKIIILDEATSHLDHESEKQILHLLDVYKQENITMIIIGYTYNILKNADLIYVLKDGKVIGKGNHDELMSKSGYYASLVKSERNDDCFEEESFDEKQRITTMRNITRRLTMSKTLMRDLNYEEEDKIKFKICEFFNLVNDKKLDLILGTIAGLLHGAGIPSLSLLLAKQQLFSWKMIRIRLKGVF